MNTKKSVGTYTDTEVVYVAGYIILGTLAAMGVLSVLWLCFGALLPGSRGGIFVCLEPPEGSFLIRYRWLRELGLWNGPLVIVTESGNEKGVQPLGCGIEVCRREDLIARLEQERDRYDAAGDGDPSGRDQRRGISEL